MVLFRCHVSDSGKLVPEDRGALDKHLQGLKGKVVWLDVRTERKPRSMDANSYLWGVVYKTISEETGYEIDEAHDLCKSMFLRPDDRYTTTMLDSARFSEYIERIRRFFSEKGIYIPSANERVDAVS